VEVGRSDSRNRKNKNITMGCTSSAVVEFVLSIFYVRPKVKIFVPVVVLVSFANIIEGRRLEWGPDKKKNTKKFERLYEVAAMLVY
jgi:hypothetical protein